MANRRGVVRALLLAAPLSSLACAARRMPGAGPNGWSPLHFDRIDVHTHLFEDQPFLVPVLDAANIRHAVILAYLGMDEPAQRADNEDRCRAVRDAHPDRFVYFPTIDVSHIEDPDYADQVVAHLDRHARLGARGLKVWKVLGMRMRDRAGKLIPVDDPRLDPVWEHLVALGWPLVIHTAEPIDAFLPLDPTSAHHGYFSKDREWYFHGRTDVYSHAELIAQRDRVIARHPRLPVIGNHFASLEHDLPGLAERLRRYPNFHTETGARFVNFIRTPREIMREFFIRHQDRILFGSDWGVNPGPRVGDADSARKRDAAIRFFHDQFRYLETDEEVSFGGVSGRGLALPEEALRKIYRDNARRLIPGV